MRFTDDSRLKIKVDIQSLFFFLPIREVMQIDLQSIIGIIINAFHD